MSDSLCYGTLNTSVKLYCLVKVDNENTVSLARGEFTMSEGYTEQLIMASLLAVSFKGS